MTTTRFWARSLFCVLILISTTVIAQQRLDKPGLLGLQDFSMFEDGLKANLPKVNVHRLEKWAPGWIPEDCQKAAASTFGAQFALTDINVFNVHYDDCASPWVMCHHKNSPDVASHLFEIFSRIPVHARSHVRTLISLPPLPGGGVSAYYNDGLIAIITAGSGTRPTETSHLRVLVHEVGHALDISNAYADKPLSLSQNWKDAYDQDSKVPDPYAQTNFAEDLAQNTVVAAFDLNVPGGLGSLSGNHDWSSFHHQYELVKKEQGDAGDLLKPGGNCTARLENSKLVKIPTSRKMGRAMRGMTMMEGKPNVDLAEGLEVIAPPKGHSTEGTCLRH